MGSSIKTGHWGLDRGLASVEHLVWLGDLNYRLRLDDAKVRQCSCASHERVEGLGCEPPSGTLAVASLKGQGIGSLPG